MTDASNKNVHRFVASLTFVGGLAALSALALGSTQGTVVWQASVLLVAMVLSGYLPLRFRFRGQITGFTLEEAVFLAMVLLLPSGLPPVLAGVGAALGHALQRQRPLKVAFNAGQIALWSSAATWAFHAISSGTALFGAGTLMAVGVSAVTLNLVSLMAFAELFRRLEGRPWRKTVEDVWAIFVVTTVGNISAGLLLAFVLVEDPRAAVFLGVLMVGLYLGYRGYAGVLEERERNERLHDVTQTLASATGSPDALGRFLAQLAKLFGGERAEIVVIVRDAARYLAVDADGRLEDRTGEPLPRLLDEALHGGHALLHTQTDAEANNRDALAAPLTFEGKTVGALAVYDRHGLEPWDQTDVKLLSTLAHEAAVAVRNVELVSELSEETRKLGNIVTAASDGIALLDPRGRVVTWNPAFARMTGRSREEALGHIWDEVIPADAPTRERLDATFDTVLSGGTLDLPLDLQVERAPNERRWLRCTFAPVETDSGDGDNAGVVVIARDVTRERETEELKADFIATVSHELRTPLTPLKGFLVTAEKHWDSLDREQLREMLTSMRRQVDRLETLIADLLVIADLDRPGSSLQHGRVHLPTLVEVVAGSFSEEQAARIRTVTDRPAHGIGDGKAVQRVVRALVDNALKHTAGAVTITVEASGSHALVEVTDEGPGIQEWEHDVIFERFGRLGDHLTRSQGPGLGLAIARSLTERLGGRLELRSAPGRGSTFTLSLPIASHEGVSQPAV